MLTRATLSTIHDDLFPTPTSTQGVLPKHALPWKPGDYIETTANQALRNVHFEKEWFIGRGSAFVRKDTNNKVNGTL
jgi:hypothetical protein